MRRQWFDPPLLHQKTYVLQILTAARLTALFFACDAVVTCVRKIPLTDTHSLSTSAQTGLNSLSHELRARYMKAGSIGLWTKADAQTHFDDLIGRSYS